MITRIMPAGEEAYRLSAELFTEGKLVAFPTETVYGLGANALNETAVNAIFAAKGRPADNPLIVHIYRADQLKDFCEVPPRAEELMRAFWPGPLTMLFPRKSIIPDVVTAGLPTVAVRMPSHPAARAMLEACDLPIAAPSANRSGRPSPTTAAHVLEDLDGAVPLIIDGGSCEVGLESTVLDLCHGAPCILRPGGVTREMLESVLGTRVELAGSILRPLQPGEVALSPGMRYKHYAPKGSVTLVKGREEAVLRRLKALYREAEQEGKRVCVLCFTEHMAALKECHPYDIGSCQDDRQVAHRLFDVLRRLDEEEMDVAYSEVVPPEGVGLAVMNRLGRAAAFQTINADEE